MKPSPPRTLRVMLFGTSVSQTNGYSVVTYNLVKQLARDPGLTVQLFGFQRNPANVRKCPPNVYEYDATANEVPYHQGFGYGRVADAIRRFGPDVCVVYNDAVVVRNVVSAMPYGRSFKLVVYADQVYLNQPHGYVEFLNRETDAVIAFTRTWEDNVKRLGVTVPTSYLPHGFDPDAHFPVPADVARRYFGLPSAADAVTVLNLNRNTPRKRWDLTLMAFVELLRRLATRPIDRAVILLVGTSNDGAYDIVHVYQAELHRRGLAIDEGMKCVRFVNDRQALSDRAVNYLYSASDVGINTCEGEGFGLNTLQHAAVGRPQVAPRTNAFVEYLDDDVATLVDPAHEYYACGMTGDGPGGCLAQSCSPVAFADALETYVRDPEIRARHGAAARARILERFAWPDIGRKLARILRGVVGTTTPESDAFDLVRMRPATVERRRPPGRTDICRTSVSAGARPVGVSWSAPCRTDSRSSTSAS